MERQAAGLKHFTSILTILLWNWGTGPVAHSHPVVQYWENETTSSAGLVLRPQLSFYSADAFFNGDSRRTDLTNGLSTSRWYLDLKGNYALNDEIDLFARLSLLNTKISNPLTEDTSTLGLSDQLLGAAYRVYSNPGGISVSLQADITIPAYSNGKQKQNGDPYLGDGSFDYVLGSFVQVPLPFVSERADWLGEIGAALRVRSNAYSSAIPWSLMLKRKPEISGFLFEGGFRGQFSLDTDGSSLAAATTDQVLGAAGSQLVFAINPSWMIAHLMAGYKTEGGPSYYALMGLPMSGKNAPAGFQLSAGATFDLGGPAAPRSQTRVASADTRSAPASSAPPPERPSTPPRTTRDKISNDSVDSLSYNFNAEVTSVNDSLHLVKIDMGSGDGIAKGQTFDIFRFVTDPDTGRRQEQRVARAEVLSVKSSEAALSVVEYFIDQWVEKGFIARRLVK